MLQIFNGKSFLLYSLLISGLLLGLFLEYRESERIASVLQDTETTISTAQNVLERHEELVVQRIGKQRLDNPDSISTVLARQSWWLHQRLKQIRDGLSIMQNASKQLNAHGSPLDDAHQNNVADSIVVLFDSLESFCQNAPKTRIKRLDAHKIQEKMHDLLGLNPKDLTQERFYWTLVQAQLLQSCLLAQQFFFSSMESLALRTDEVFPTVEFSTPFPRAGEKFYARVYANNYFTTSNHLTFLVNGKVIKDKNGLFHYTQLCEKPGTIILETELRLHNPATGATLSQKKEFPIEVRQ